MMKCQYCSKELEPPFETARQLCHKCNVETEIEFQKLSQNTSNTKEAKK